MTRITAAIQFVRMYDTQCMILQAQDEEDELSIETLGGSFGQASILAMGNSRNSVAH